MQSPRLPQRRISPDSRMDHDQISCNLMDWRFSARSLLIVCTKTAQKTIRVQRVYKIAENLDDLAFWQSLDFA